MDDSSQLITPRDDIIREAEAISELTISELVEYGAKVSDSYVGEPLQLLVALETLQGNGYIDEEWFGPDDSYTYRIDRWLVNRYTDGSRDSVEFATEEQAIAAMAK